MRIHFIGIGGIGISALARYYLEKGYEISGSDLTSSEITKSLKKAGAKTLIGKHKKKNVPKNADMIIYSPAVEKDNPELKKAYKIQDTGYNIQIKSYPQALGELTKKYFTIAVSGTHGKSTTTSMLALVLIKAGLDPTVIVGTKLKEFDNSNFRAGKSQYLLIEADEWKGSFLNYWPKIIVLTNIDKEHLDFYKNLNHILKTYKEYISHLPEDGVLAANKDDNNVNKIFNYLACHRLSPKAIAGRQFSRLPSAIAEGDCGQAIFNKFSIKQFSIKQKEAKKIKKILEVPGTHNVYNALAVLETARVLRISDEITYEALSQYRGAWRRFETSNAEICGNSRGTARKIMIVSDYGHHPNEIKATLEAAREKYRENPLPPKAPARFAKASARRARQRKIWCVFQPHQYQRTYYLFKEFVEVFRKAKIDKIIITDIYNVTGRESNEIKKKVNSEKLVKKINSRKVIYKKENELKNYLLENLKGGEVLIIMGAGSIYELAENLFNCGQN